MKQKPFIILGIMLCLFAAYFILKPKEKKPVIDSGDTISNVTSSNDLPHLPFTRLDGTKQTAREIKGKVVLVFFHPDCDHCQREITQIRENRQAFKEYQVYFFSDAQIPLIAKFTQDYKVANEPNFIFSQVALLDVLNTVGPIATPSVYIYTDKGKLIKAFNGETPIENIMAFM